jgi:hypothetical protein
LPAFLLSCLLTSAAQSADQPLSVGAAVETPSAESCAPATVTDTAVPTAVAEPAPLKFSLADASTASASAADLSGDYSLGAVVGGQDNPAPQADEGYSGRVFWRQAKSIPWRFGGAAAAITATGFANWDWGSSRFRFNSEGWFGKDTASLGVDKLGHAYSAYVLSEFFTDGINNAEPGSKYSAYTGALLSMGLMTYIEVFDGFSKEHGFSYEDLVVDAAGALFSVARRTVPGLREKVDFRLLYTPDRSTFRALSCLPKPNCERDGETFRSPIQDYSNQKYLLALKLSGFEKLRTTPLRLVELHGGYYARGFTPEERERGEPLRRRLFVGVGLNVGELLFPGRPRGAARAAKSVLEYLQIPYTAIHSK